MQVFDTARNRWKLARAVPFDGTVALVRGSVYVSDATGRAAQFNPAKGKWKLLPGGIPIEPAPSVQIGG